MILFILFGVLIITVETIACFVMLVFACQFFGKFRYPLYFFSAVLAYPGLISIVGLGTGIGLPIPFLAVAPFEVFNAIISPEEYEFLSFWEPFLPSSAGGSNQADGFGMFILVIWIVIVISVIYIFESKRSKKQNERDDSDQSLIC